MTSPAAAPTVDAAKGGEISLSTKLFYGFGSVAYGVKDGGFRSFLLLFYNQVIGLPASLVATAIMVALVVDSVLDPIIGQVSDNWRSRWGRRHPFMYAAAIPVALSYVLLWNPPSGWSNDAMFLYIVATAVVVRSFITMYEIPSSSLVAEMTDDYDQRTSILSYRYFFGWWGALGMGLVTLLVFLQPNERYPVGQLNKEGYMHYGWAAAAVMLVAILVSAMGTHRIIPSLHKPLEGPRRGTLAVLREMGETVSNRAFLMMMGSGLFTAMAQGTAAALTFYFATFYWELSPEQTSILVLDGFFAALFGLWIAPRLSRRFGKKELALALLAGGVLVGAAPFGLRMAGAFPANGAPALVACLFIVQLIAASMSITKSILVHSMIADVVENSQAETGRRSEGLFFSANAFIQKAISGVGVFITGMILSVVGFPDGARPGQVDQAVLDRLVLVYLPVLLGVYAIAMLFLSLYRISRESHAETVRRLKEAASLVEGDPKAAGGVEVA